MSKAKQNAFLALYEPVHERFERFCRARVYGDMDYQDLMNETLLIAYSKIDSLRVEEAFLSFLFTISMRVLANNKRKRKEQALPVDENHPAYQDGAKQASTSDNVNHLHFALGQLPEAHREALILFEISGFNIKEIAAMQEASEAAIKQRLKRGRDQLRNILYPKEKLNAGGMHYGNK